MLDPLGSRSICSEPANYDKSKRQLIEQLQARGYQDGIIKAQLKKVDNLKRDDLLHYKKKERSTHRVPLVLTFSAALPDTHKILKDRSGTLLKSSRLTEVFKQPPIVAYRRDSSLGDILVHKKHNKMFFDQPKKSEPCGKKCAICPYLKDTETFTSFDGHEYRVKNYINCKSVNVVYALLCSKCDSFVYVGETGDSLYQRQLLNLSLIRRKVDDPVANHFNAPGHCLSHFSIIGIEKLYGSPQYRKNIEQLWIHKLRTFRPHGINTKQS